MATVHSKSNAPARRNGSPTRSSDQVSSQAGSAGAATVQMAEKTPQPVLGAFYQAGPALSLTGSSSSGSNGANGHGPPSGPAGNGRNGGGDVQFKLAISRPGDPYEREADAAADRVTSGGVAPAITPLGPGALSRMATLQRQGAEEEQEQAPDEEVVQPCACEEERQGSVEPPRVQRRATDEEREEPADLEETVQPLAIQRQVGEEEEQEPEVVQPCANCDQERNGVVQRQGEEEEEPTDQESAVQPLAIQREAGDEKDQEPEIVQPCENCEEKRSEAVQRQGDEEEEEPADQEEAVQRQDEKEEEPAEVQTAPANGTVASAAGNGSVGSALSHPGGGAPLAPSVRSRLEPGLGADLSGVRLHSDSAAHETAHALKARAFTHGQDIWLGAGESSTDTHLMAHEATHVLQQTGGDDGVQMVQRAPADYRHPEDGGGVEGRLNGRFRDEIDESEERPNPAEARRKASQVDRGELAAKKGEVSGDTRPDVDRPAEESPGINQSAATVEQEAESPPDPLVEGEQAEQPQAEEGAGEEAVGAAEQASSLADQAFATAASQPEPTPEVAVDPPAPIAPVDSAGDPLDANPAADEAMFGIAERAQYFREQGAQLRAQAAEGHSNAETTRGNLAKVSAEVSKAEEGISTSQDHATYRREVVGQAEQALGVSEEKQAQVAAQAPDFQSKADEGKEDTGPMAGEASSLAAENAANTPDDEEAAANAREQGGQIEQVGGESQTMDSAVSQTRGRADSLAADAARAAELNTQARSNIDNSTQQLDQLDQRLGEHQTQAADARSQVESMGGAPDELHAQAEQLDQQGQALIATSFDLEEQLRSSQERYADDTRAVPALEPWEGEMEAGGAGAVGAAGAEGVLQLLPEEEEPSSAPAAGVAGAGGGPEPISTPAPAAPAPASGPAAAAGAGPTAGALAAPEAAAVPESAQAEGLDPAAAAEAQIEQGQTPEEPEAAPGAEEGAEAEGAGVEGAEAAPAEGAATEGLEPIEVPEAGAAGQRSQIDVLHEMPPWLTGVDPQSAEQREQAAQAAEEQRLAELDRINQLAGGRPISQLGAGERLGIAMRLVGQRYFGAVSNIRWPGWGGLAKALLDPRSMIAGAVGGLNMILSGGANLFSAEQWRRDPLGNLLKSAADIATGLAIILGSITALAGIVAAIMGALILITFGFAAPIALPVISVCATIITTVGGWTIAVGKIALVLQALSLIKNLIDAATAQTAEELQREAGEIQSDINGGFQAAMSIVGAKGAQAGIRNLSARAGRTVAARTAAGGSRALARQTARALPGAARAAMRRFRRRLVTAPRRAGRRLRAAGRAIVEAPGRAVRAVRDRVRSIRDRLRRGRPDREAIGPHAQTLDATRAKGLSELSERELQAELSVVRNTRPRRITRGDYVEEVRLPNGHTWRRNSRGVWCRFSDGAGCLVTPSGGLPANIAAHADEARRMADKELRSAIRANPKGTPRGDALRYERYRRSGGTRPYDEWLGMSRGGRRGGPAHRSIQNNIAADTRYGAPRTEVPVPGTGRVADGYWPNGPNGKPVYHQIGGRNLRGDPIARERAAIAEIRRSVGDNADIMFWDKRTGQSVLNPDRLPSWRPPTQ